MKKRIVITGASGFIGKHLLNEINLTEWQVRIISRNPSKLDFAPAEMEIFQADLHDVDSLISAFQSCDVLIHMAAEIRIDSLLEKTNIEGTKNVLKAIEKSSIKKIIHLSSVGVLGYAHSSKKVCVTENFEAKPNNEYERTKWISEQLFSQAASTNSIKLHILRPTNVFGEHHPFQALLHLMQHIQKGKMLPYVSGAQVNYVYVKDLTAAILQQLREDASPCISNVGYAMNLEDFYTTMSLKLGVKSNTRNIPSFFVTFAQFFGIHRLDSIANFVAYSDDNLRAHFSYPHGIEKGIENTIEYYKKEDFLN